MTNPLSLQQPDAPSYQPILESELLGLIPGTPMEAYRLTMRVNGKVVWEKTDAYSLLRSVSAGSKEAFEARIDRDIALSEQGVLRPANAIIGSGIQLPQFLATKYSGLVAYTLGKGEAGAGNGCYPRDIMSDDIPAALETLQRENPGLDLNSPEVKETLLPEMLHRNYQASKPRNFDQFKYKSHEIELRQTGQTFDTSLIEYIYVLLKKHPELTDGQGVFDLPYAQRLLAEQPFRVDLAYAREAKFLCPQNDHLLRPKHKNVDSVAVLDFGILPADIRARLVGKMEKLHHASLESLLAKMKAQGRKKAAKVQRMPNEILPPYYTVSDITGDPHTRFSMAITEEEKAKILTYNQKAAAHNKRVDKYNEEVDTYNETIGEHNKEVDTYNKEIEAQEALVGVYSKRAKREHKPRMEYRRDYKATLPYYEESSKPHTEVLLTKVSRGAIRGFIADKAPELAEALQEAGLPVYRYNRLGKTPEERFYLLDKQLEQEVTRRLSKLFGETLEYVPSYREISGIRFCAKKGENSLDVISRHEARRLFLEQNGDLLDREPYIRRNMKKVLDGRNNKDEDNYHWIELNCSPKKLLARIDAFESSQKCIAEVVGKNEEKVEVDAILEQINRYVDQINQSANTKKPPLFHFKRNEFGELIYRSPRYLRSKLSFDGVELALFEELSQKFPVTIEEHRGYKEIVFNPQQLPPVLASLMEDPKKVQAMIKKGKAIATPLCDRNYSSSNKAEQEIALATMPVFPTSTVDLFPNTESATAMNQSAVKAEVKEAEMETLAAPLSSASLFSPKGGGYSITSSEVPSSRAAEEAIKALQDVRRSP